MPGQYVVVSRAAGTLITQLVYNFDHQNHIDGRSAEEMGSYGVSASQFQGTEQADYATNPNLPSSLAFEIMRLRFVLAQIITELSGGIQAVWYDACTAPGLAVVGARVVRGTDLSIPYNTATVIDFSGAVDDFNSGVFDAMTQPTRFTAPIAGKYFLFCALEWAAATGGRRQIQAGVNGIFGANALVSNIVPAASIQTQALTGLVDLQPLDYVQFRVFHNQTAAVALNLVGFSPRSIVGGLVFLGT